MLCTGGRWVLEVFWRFFMVKMVFFSGKWEKNGRKRTKNERKRALFG
jgi:hypothetical protein